jgi:hypothetical protein
MTTHLFENINRLSDDELVERVRSGHYGDEAHAIAVDILKNRSIEIPDVEPNYIKTKIPLYKSHPIWFWTMVSVAVTMISRLIKQMLQT